MIKKKSKLHLGGKVAKPFREGIDDEDSAFKDPFTEVKFSSDHMDWMVARVSKQHDTRPYHTMRCAQYETGREKQLITIAVF